MRTRSILALALAAAAVSLLIVAGASANGGLTPKEELGKALLFDENLSSNSNQSCATCHAPEVGYTGPDGIINAHGAVYEGSIPGAFGDRKPPTARMAATAPCSTMMKLRGSGSAACSGTAGPRAGPWVTRWPSRRRDPS